MGRRGDPDPPPPPNMEAKRLSEGLLRGEGDLRCPVLACMVWGREGWWRPASPYGTPEEPAAANRELTLPS